MKAVVQVGYGSADVIELREIERPTAGPGEVLVRILAASLAAGDYFGMRGRPFPAPLVIGFPRPKKDHVVGLDFAGVVEAVGADVTRVGPGDEVYGECRGSCAEYAVASVGRNFVAGEMQGKPVGQGMWLLVAVIMLVPIVMLVLSLTLPYPAIRWVTLVAAVASVLFNLAGLPDEGAYDDLLIAVSFVFCRLIVWSASTWSVPS